MQHFTVDTREINKSQWKALKALARVAGLDVTMWEWKDRKEYRYANTLGVLNRRPDMHKGDDVRPPVPYPEPEQTPAQKAGFEVGSLGVVLTDADAPSLEVGDIVRLSDDDGSPIPYWDPVVSRETRNRRCADVSGIRPLTNLMGRP